MTSLAAIIDALEPIKGSGWRTCVPADWQQGRTAYGGLSTALALHAAQRSDQDLPPLRSAQIAFVGPLSGEVLIRAQRLRRGRNAAFVQADVEGEHGLGLRATFVFMQPLDSKLDHRIDDAPAFAAPQPGDKVYPGIAAVPFTQHFEFLDRREGVGPAEWQRWVRLRERDGLDPAVELLAVADCLPPAALKLLGGPASTSVPISSVTWMINLVAPSRTRDGWWLLAAGTQHASAGTSSQRMAIWNTDGRSVAEQMQSVAIFG